MKGDLNLNTVISFIANTNLQHYSGESALSLLSQNTGILLAMFVSVRVDILLVWLFVVLYVVCKWEIFVKILYAYYYAFDVAFKFYFGCNFYL
ncbi:potassium-transporting ATPase subunit KdpA [Campylobacter jejuni]|nr:potassium-transporting ATPase subunit KdpA [Campylobacter jejuni]